MRKGSVLTAGVLLGLCVLTSLLGGCVVGVHPEGYYDRAHARWWHNHAWVACTPRDFHCR